LRKNNITTEEKKDRKEYSYGWGIGFQISLFGFYFGIRAHSTGSGQASSGSFCSTHSPLDRFKQGSINI
jgi:hypothetical protein